MLQTTDVSWLRGVYRRRRVILQAMMVEESLRTKSSLVVGPPIAYNFFADA
jgi:hypothetical protein